MIIINDERNTCDTDDKSDISLNPLGIFFWSYRKKTYSRSKGGT